MARNEHSSRAWKLDMTGRRLFDGLLRRIAPRAQLWPPWDQSRSVIVSAETGFRADSPLQLQCLPEAHLEALWHLCLKVYPRRRLGRPWFRSGPWLRLEVRMTVIRNRIYLKFPHKQIPLPRGLGLVSVAIHTAVQQYTKRGFNS